MNNNISASVMELANKHLSPYHIRNGQIISKFCPFCKGGSSEDEDTFAVGLYNGAFNCLRGSCGKTGNFRELCEFFGEEAPVTVGASLRLSQQRRAFVRPHEEDIHELTEEILAYLGSRKLSKETLEAFRVGSDEHGNIVFPFYRDNKLIYVKYREPHKYVKTQKHGKEWQMADTQPILFGMDNVSYRMPLIITEGEIDALSLYEAGVSNVVSVPTGCSNLGWIDTCWDFLEKFQQIILFGDMDEPGLAMMSTLMNRLGEDRCMLPPDYPECIVEGKSLNRCCKDANEILILYGKEYLYDLVQQCEPAPVNGVLNLADIPFVDPTTLPRIYTRIPALDDMIGGLGEGGVTVITGKRGNGKSTITGQMLLNAVQQGYKVCAYSGELSAYKFLEWIFLQATESKYVGITEDQRTGKKYPSVSPEIQRRIRAWMDGSFYLFDNTYVNEKMTQQEAVLNVFRICARRYGCKLFLVDNMMISMSATSAEQENKAQSNFASALKTFAVKNKVHVILVAHPRKTMADKPLGNDDVAGSSNITNIADNVIVVERPDLRVTKNRDFGVCDNVSCEFNPANRRVYQSSVGDRTVYGWNHENLEEPEERADELPAFAIQRKQDDTGLYM